VVQYWIFIIAKIGIGEGAKVVKHSRYVIFQMAEVMVSKSLFHEILERIRRLTLVALTPGAG